MSFYFFDVIFENVQKCHKSTFIEKHLVPISLKKIRVLIEKPYDFWNLLVIITN